MSKTAVQVPKDSWKAFGYLINKCASGLCGELIEQGKTDDQARNAVIHAFLDMAAGEACRMARANGRDPDPEKWLKATTDAFERALKRTSEESPE